MELLLGPDSSASAAPHLLPVAHLSPACVQVELSQEDLTMLLRIPLENLGEASSLGQRSHKQDAGVHVQTCESASTGTPAQTQTSQTRPGRSFIFHVFSASAAVGTLTVCDEEGESLETLRFTVNIESLALVLNSNHPKQVSESVRLQRSFTVSARSGTAHTLGLNSL